MNSKEKAFIATVWQYYYAHGRHSLLWRQTNDPYQIVVSEIMLQQMQVDRVLPKYEIFTKRFPDVQSLAAAPLAEVLRLWQGLGYNRRAQYLHQCAKLVVLEHAGTFPSTETALRSLPGIGTYTAGAVLAFAYNKAVPIIETNIRTVYIHHFFHQMTTVTDHALLVKVQRTLPEEREIRNWYYALMDYGVYLKRTGKDASSKSTIYKKQSKFAGSDRQLRGTIIRLLVNKKSVTKQYLYKNIATFTSAAIDTQLIRLMSEGLIMQSKRQYTLAT